MSDVSKYESQNLAGLVLSKPVTSRYESQSLAGQLAPSKYESQNLAGRLAPSKYESQNPEKESSLQVDGKPGLAPRKREPHCGIRFGHSRLTMIGRLQQKLPRQCRTKYGT